MPIKIERGIRKSAARIVLYGTEGIGKSTLAAKFPNPVIIDTEDGTGRIDCARVVCRDWVTLEGSLLDLAGDPQGFDTVVIDSADWAERQMLEQMLRKAGKRSIEDFGFGKGYTMLAEHVARLLALADQIVAKGLNVCFVAHSTVKRTSPPDMDEGYDRYELKLSRQVSPLFKEWADALLFANYRTKLVEGSDGRKKGRGGKERIIFTERAAAWDAKNRFGLPAEIPMTIEALGPLFGAPAKITKLSLRELIAVATTEEQLGKIGDSIDEQVSKGKLTDVQVAELMGRINARHQEIVPEVAHVA
jgi:hypothetical protein